MQSVSLQAMTAFCRVVDLRSFGAAGRSLETTGGAISKLIAQLERSLGVRLLHRTTRTVTVSSEGAAFYEAAARILDDVEAAAGAVRSQSSAPAGRLKVSVPTSFALMWLSRRLPRFIAAHPQLQLDLVLNDRYVDIVQEGFDCAVRIATRLADSTLVARPLGTVERWIVAAPSYLESAPPLQTPEDIDSHVCLTYAQEGGAVEWPLKGTTDNQPLAVTGTCRTNNSVMLRDLLVAGLGLTLTPDFVVDDLVRRGQLVEVLVAHRPAPLTVWGMVAHQRYVSHKIRVFLDFVASEMSGPQIDRQLIARHSPRVATPASTQRTVRAARG